MWLGGTLDTVLRLHSEEIFNGWWIILSRFLLIVASIPERSQLKHVIAADWVVLIDAELGF